MKMKKGLQLGKKLGLKLSQFLFPSFCMSCGKAGVNLCADCETKILILPKQRCPTCAKLFKNGEFCGSKCRGGWSFDGLIVASKYHRTVVGKIIKIFKYEFSVELAGILGAIAVKQFLSQSVGEAVLSCVPLHPRRENWRGFNQAREIGRVVAERLDVEFLEPLVRVCDTRPQAELPRSERLENVRDSFALRETFEGKISENVNWIIFDDVATTCATLNECAKILRLAGATKIYGLVLARGGDP